MKAIEKGDIEAVVSLLDEGVDVNKKSFSVRHTPLHRAVARADIARILLDRGADVNAKDVAGHTPLHLAASGGYSDTVRILLDRGADVNARSSIQQTRVAEIHRFGLGQPPVTQPKDAKGRPYVLLGAGVPRVTYKPGVTFGEYTPLYHASKNGHADTVRILLNRGADVNAKEHNGDTALHGAASAGHIDVVRLLLEKGGDIGMANKTGKTPFDMAEEKGHTAVVEMMLELSPR
jgi:ankyrin repeat protein